MCRKPEVSVRRGRWPWALCRCGISVGLKDAPAKAAIRTSNVKKRDPPVNGGPLSDTTTAALQS